MTRFVIMVDAGSDLPTSFITANDIRLVPMSFTLDGQTHVDDGGVSFPHAAFYEKLRSGSMSSTSMVNVETFTEQFKAVLDTGANLLVLPFSSGISGTANSARLAAEDIRALYPGQKLIVVDTLAASLGAGLIVYYAVKMRGEGKTIDETAEWLRENLLNFQHLFTVDDLDTLQRGGRISKATAVVGSIIGMKPVLDVDPDGKLRSVGKVRGRRASLDELVDMMSRLTLSHKLECIAVSHGDAEEDADYLIAKVKEKVKVGEVIKNNIGPLIGSHSGPGTIALFFYGRKRV